ncbi:enoyl-CoA hydratase/isomerase family protein [Oceanobacillus rekensis]|uniref:enoyl-CoA hydratase/isomerase family protein n=1 Tax=Oceanobacillus rekensis TaxID=937927 RepID=UPI000B442929|nr:enoyl-CoA hydratase/isomerase family protein [Oceanobacillus rekensis]
MTELVTYKRNRYGYGEIYLNRPEKRNAISLEMQQDLSECLQKARQDSIKFLTILGAGEYFCAGGDLNVLHGGLTPEDAFALLYPMKEVLYQIVTFPVPTICLLNGDALGGGCEIATACDVRIARKNTTFGFVQTSLGILPSWGGGALLYEKVSPSFAMNWLMEAKRYPAMELKERGWLHVVSTDKEWNDHSKLLQNYISKSLRQMIMLKEQYLTEIIGDLSERMDKEVHNAANLWDSDEHIAAVEKFLSRK